MKRRPNYYLNRYNQYVIAGKIAVKTDVINPYDDKGKLIEMYRTNEGELHYSVIGQDYMRLLDITAIEL